MSTTPHILICDDDPIVHESLRIYLDSEHFTYSSAYDGEAGIQQVLSEKPDLILLDLMMPNKTGIEVCREVRKSLSTPIIILTARGEEIDRVLGLELGADDYIVKPFSPREVIARIKAVLRRVKEQPKANPALRFDGLEIHLDKYQVIVKDEKIPFTPKEVEILHLLASHIGQVMEREDILNSVWGDGFSSDIRTIDTHIKRIRQKISCEDATWSLVTVYGVGYKFEVQG